MARRYRYAFAKKKEAPKGKLSTGLFVVSLLLFFAAIAVNLQMGEDYGFLTGGICLFAALLSVYGFLVGLSSFSGDNYMHRTSIIGSIANGVSMVGWLGFFLLGLR